MKKEFAFILVLTLTLLICENATSSSELLDSTSISPIPIQLKLPIQEEEPIIKKIKSDTIYYRYNNSSSPSVIVFPAVEGRSRIEFYSPNGEKTYEMEEVQLGYSVSIQFSAWNENGSVAQVEEHLNPGASLYYYNTVYLFDNSNQPTWKTSTQYPMELDSIKQYYWKKDQKMWVMQETIECNPPREP